jgi:hypothetical protein
MDGIILSYIKQLNDELLQAHLKLYEAHLKKEYMWHSKETQDLYSALAKAQGEFKSAVKTKRHNFSKYNYAGLDDLLNAVLPALSKNGLCVIQPPVEDPTETGFVYTRLAHASGQWIEGRMRLRSLKPGAGQNELQAQGTQITYFKKYILEGLVGISRSEDTDGVDVDFAEDVKKKEVKVDEPIVEKITQDQHTELMTELKDHPSLSQEILNKLGLTKLSDMPKSIFPSSIKRIREIKKDIK